ERRRPVGNESSGTVPGLEHAQRGKCVQSGAQTRAAYAQSLRELALRRQPIAGPQVTSLDHLAHSRNYLFGGQPCNVWSDRLEFRVFGRSHCEADYFPVGWRCQARSFSSQKWAQNIRKPLPYLLVTQL